jgi:hypothetical protein
VDPIWFVVALSFSFLVLSLAGRRTLGLGGIRIDLGLERDDFLLFRGGYVPFSTGYLVAAKGLHVVHQSQNRGRGAIVVMVLIDLFDVTREGLVLNLFVGCEQVVEDVR